MKRPTPNRRKLFNLVSDSHAVFRLFVPFFVVFFAAFAVIWGMDWHLTRKLLQNDSVLSAQELEAVRLIVTETTAIAVAGMLGIGALSYVLWLLCSHRVFGTLVALRRQITELRDGKYESRVTLRERDELKPVADELNRLADSLQKLRDSASESPVRTTLRQPG